MNNRPVAIAAVISLLLSVGVIGLFAFQNHTRTTQLSLDLGVAAVQLQQPVQVPVLMGICLLAGFLPAAAVFGIRASSANRRARRLEQELALAGGSSSDGWR